MRRFGTSSSRPSTSSTVRDFYHSGLKWTEIKVHKVCKSPEQRLLAAARAFLTTPGVNANVEKALLEIKAHAASSNDDCDICKIAVVEMATILADPVRPLE